MGKTMGCHTILKKEYKTYNLSQEWLNTFGEVERNFKMIVWGASGSGKTSLVMRFCKYFAEHHGKVYYNSKEQGDSKSMQKCLNSVGAYDLPKGKLMIGDRDSFNEMFEKIRKTHAKLVVIDSIDYINLTVHQYKKLIETFPGKAFILISWEGSGGEPKLQPGKDIRYMADIKCYVSNLLAKADSRYGHTFPYKIFDKEDKAGDQLTLSYSKRKEAAL